MWLPPEQAIGMLPKGFQTLKAVGSKPTLFYMDDFLQQDIEDKEREIDAIADDLQLADRE